LRSERPDLLEEFYGYLYVIKQLLS